jgi:ubiquinone/menaquinone biosynthesis C-methylase UbiE
MRSAPSLWWRLVRFGFRLLYNEFAFSYDLVSKVVSLGAWRCWQQSALKHLNDDGWILELAHGTGDLQIDLADAGCRAVGYDLSPAMGRIARRKLLKRGLKVPLVRGMAQALPFHSEQFSRVVSTFPSDFITAPETLAEVQRVLQLGGVFVVVPAASFTGGGAVKAALEWLYRISGQRQAETAFESPEIVEWLAPYGFEVETVHEPCPRSVALVILARKVEIQG